MRKLLYKIICPVGTEFNCIGALVMLILRRSRKVVNHYYSFDNIQMYYNITVQYSLLKIQ